MYKTPLHHNSHASSAVDRTRFLRKGDVTIDLEPLAPGESRTDLHPSPGNFEPEGVAVLDVRHLVFEAGLRDGLLEVG